jgi:hypothetical protein
MTDCLGELLSQDKFIASPETILMWLSQSLPDGMLKPLKDIQDHTSHSA